MNGCVDEASWAQPRCSVMLLADCFVVMTCLEELELLRGKEGERPKWWGKKTGNRKKK